MLDPGYFSDMQIVDERLKKLEKDYTKITKLLEDLIKKLTLLSRKYNKENK